MAEKKTARQEDSITSADSAADLLAARLPNLYTRAVLKAQKVVRGFLGRVKFKLCLKRALEEADAYWSEGENINE
jgi:hypothetical protein